MRNSEIRRREAWLAVQRAARVYELDPSPANAAFVEQAWQRVRQLDSVRAWQDCRFDGLVEASQAG
ncbi:MAG: hypothetical protein ACFB6S_19525 [Geminicoccaceae bacterium]